MPPLEHGFYFQRKLFTRSEISYSICSVNRHLYEYLQTPGYKIYFTYFTPQTLAYSLASYKYYIISNTFINIVNIILVFYFIRTYRKISYGHLNNCFLMSCLEILFFLRHVVKFHLKVDFLVFMTSKSAFL